jgi:7,8-dihydropterin-6-yl-methyl-4-(beta-D-ribofuranosyl)aminobenzene 5'-phosphate synthase
MDRIVKIEKNQEAAPSFHLLTDIPNKYSKPHGDQRLKMRFEGETKPDTFEHEMVTVFDGVDGIIVLTGCAHNGVLNMIAAAQKYFPGKPITAVIGGFHLHHEDDQTVQEIGNQLLAMGLPRIITGHCTGDAQMDILKDVLGDRLDWLYSGKVMTF